MRRLNLAFFAVFLAFSGCAKDPDRDTGGAGSSGSAGTGGSGGGTDACGGAGLTGYTPPALTVARPNPIISRGAQVFSMPAGGAAVVNGVYHDGGWGAGSPTTAAPAWVAIKLAAGPTRILVSWDDGGTYNHQDPATTTVYGLPADYHFEVSADSTNGSDGVWTAAGAPVTGNNVRTRAHALDFAGKTWIKMVITAAPPNESANGVQIGEIDVHDVSASGAGLPDDSWFFMGDSITALAYDRRSSNDPSFAKLINTAAPAYFPAMINGGIGGENTAGALARIDAVLATNPDYRFFAITYGTNDSWSNNPSTSAFKSNLQAMIDKIKAAGRVPVLSHLPFSGDGNHGTLGVFNAAIDELTQTNQLQLGPDLCTYFAAHPDELQADKVHPATEGDKTMNKLWADAMRVVYP